MGDSGEGYRDLSEYGLMRKIKGGDEGAFTELVRRYSRAVSNVIQIMIKQDHEDVVQEVFARIWRYAPGWRGEGVSAWIMKIAVRAAYKELKGRRRRAVEKELEEEHFLPSNLKTPIDDAVMAEQIALFHDCFDLLPESRKALAVMKWSYEMTEPQIANATGIPLPTVRSRVRTALAELNRCVSSKVKKEDIYG